MAGLQLMRVSAVLRTPARLPRSAGLQSLLQQAAPARLCGPKASLQGLITPKGLGSGSEERPAGPPPPPSPPQLPPQPPQQPAWVAFVAISTGFYALMTAAAVALGNAPGVPSVGAQLLAPPDAAAALWLLPMLAFLYASVECAAAFREIKNMYTTALIPQLRGVPLWGLGLVALGAGVGEEALFRGVLQARAADALAGGVLGGLQLPGCTATLVALAGTSLVFGALHSVTPTYFYFATGAGALFGAEFLVSGLPAAAATHVVYDWLALAYVLHKWGGEATTGGPKRSG